MAERPLTLKQRRFAEALPTARSASEAARIAGYSESPGGNLQGMASLNLRKPHVMAAAEQAIQSAAEQAAVSPLWALERLKEHREAAIASQQFGPANTAVELIGKHLRMFGEPSLVQAGDTYNQVILQGYTMDQLEELLGKMRAPALPTPVAEAQPPLRTGPLGLEKADGLTRSKLPAKGKRVDRRTREGRSATQRGA